MGSHGKRGVYAMRSRAAAKTNWGVNKAVKLHTRGSRMQNEVCSMYAYMEGSIEGIGIRGVHKLND